MAEGVVGIEKVGFLLWEASLHMDRTDYFFQAWTKWGAVRKANAFIDRGDW